MKKFFALSLLTLIFIFGANVTAAASLTENPRIAVLGMKNKAAVSKEILEAKGSDTSWISEFIIKALIKTNRFHISERESLEDIMKEYGYSKSGVVDTSDAPKLGNLKTAQFLVAGSLTGLSTKKSRAGYENSLLGSASGNKRAVVANVIFRFIDIESGDVVLSVDGVGESSRGDATLVFNERGEEEYETDTTDTEEIPSIIDGQAVNITKHTIKIGSEEFSLVQAQNAIRKAVLDAIYNKKYGLIAEMDGTAKGERLR